jgi:VWFA-related protein
VVVSEVLLDALVTDKQGRVILGLGPDDFVVEEGGQPVEIAGVSFYSSQERSPSARIDLPGFDLSDIPEDRYFILFFQEIRSGGAGINRLFSRQQQAARAMEEWVVAKLAPADFVAVVSYGYKLKVHQDFTRDRQKLLQGIESAALGRDPERAWPSRQPPADEIGPLLRALPTGKELRKKSGNVYEGLQLLASAAATVPGRKNLVFLGIGFDPIRSSEYRRMFPTIQALNDANIAAYTIDLVPTATEHSLRASLNNLAIATGGDFFFTFIRFDSALEKVSEATSGYYLIAYRSEHPAGKSGYQRVKVKLANPEFRVWARSGYSFGAE